MFLNVFENIIRNVEVYTADSVADNSVFVKKFNFSKTDEPIGLKFSHGILE